MAAILIPYSRRVVIESTIHIIQCAACGIDFGIGAHFMTERRRDHKTFYCPNGHNNYYPQDNEEEKLRKKAASLEQRLEWANAREKSARDQAEAAERARRAQKGLNTKLKKRIANGVCPCCQRSFKDLHRHMQGQHPDYVQEGG